VYLRSKDKQKSLGDGMQYTESHHAAIAATPHICDRRLEPYIMETIFVLSLLLLSGCDNMCGSKPLNAEVSPNGKLKSVSYLYDCGATTGCKYSSVNPQA